MIGIKSKEGKMAVNKLYLSGLAVLFVLATSSAIHAETGRYTMTPTKDGVLKLDTKTGAVSLCRNVGTGWSCEAVDESDPEGLREQLRRLEKENARLRARLDKCQLSPGKRDNGKLELPSEQDVDKAMDFMEKLLNRFKGLVEDLKKDKKDDEGVPL